MPESLGRPGEDQMQGTPLERLAELAYRLKFDAMRYDAEGGIRAEFSAGISSAKLHGLLRDTSSFGYYSHYGFVLELDFPPDLRVIANRPGLQVCDDKGSFALDLRTLLEWDEWAVPDDARAYAQALKTVLSRGVCIEAPQVIGLPPSRDVERASKETQVADVRVCGPYSSPAALAMFYNVARVSLYLFGSRGALSEVARAGRFTAFTERSAIDCDDADTPRVDSPLLASLLADDYVEEGAQSHVRNDLVELDKTTRRAYSSMTQTMLVSLGASYDVQRQARAIGSGLLPLGVASEALVTATVGQWISMIRRLRTSPDSELQRLFGDGVPAALSASRYSRLVAPLL